MKPKYIFILLFFLLIFSCNESYTGIFYGLKYEEKIKDNSLSNNITVGSMAKVTNRLYIAAGNIFSKTSYTDEQWIKIAPPHDFDLSLSLVSPDGMNLYAIYYTKNDAKKRLFSLNTITNQWTEIDTSSLAGTIEDIKTANGKMLVSTRVTSNNANLYIFDGSSFSSSILSMTGATFNFIHTGVSGGGIYWVSNYNNLFKGPDLSSLSKTTPHPNLNTRYEIRGLEKLDDTTIYYTLWHKRDLRGYIGVTDGTTFYRDESVGSFMLNGIKVLTITSDPYSPVLNPSDPDARTKYPFLICATAGRGYYQVLNPSTGNLDLNRPRNNILSENYNSAVDLQDAVVLDFFIDGIEDANGDIFDADLYALTATRGLWRNSNMGGYRNWSIE